MSKPFVNPLPGVPSVESPFFDRLFADADPQTLRIARDLQTNGFAVLDFPDADFDRIADQIIKNLHGRFDWQTRSAGYGGGMRIFDAYTFDEQVRRLAVNSQIIDLLGRLFGRRAWPFQTLNFPVGTEQHVHTDSVHFSSAPERFMCGVWTALEDIGPDAGPLVYYPGSHLWPIYTNEHIGYCTSESSFDTGQEIFEPMWSQLLEAHGTKPQVFTAKKGQCLIWLANLLHGGQKQNDKSLTRWSQVTHYFFEDCAYYTPMRSDPFYGSIAFRDEITDIRSGKVVPSQYMGHKVPATFVKTTRPKEKKTRESLLPKDFNPVLYLAANPDVKLAGVDPANHYLRYGRKENRALRPAKQGK